MVSCAIEELSIEMARRAEWITLCLRHLVYILVRKPDYMPKAVDALGIEVRENEGTYEITLPGLMPKRKACQGAEFLFDLLMFALERFQRPVPSSTSLTRQSALFWPMTETSPSVVSGTMTIWS